MHNESKVIQLCLTLHPMACSLPGFSVLGIFQARILEWVTISFSRRSSQGLNPGLLHCRQMLYCLSHQGSPWQTAFKSQFFWGLHRSGRITISSDFLRPAESTVYCVNLEQQRLGVNSCLPIHCDLVMPTCLHVSVLIMSDSLQPHGLWPARNIHGILQATVPEWVAVPFSRGSSQPRGWTQVSCLADRFFTIWATRGAPP